MLKPLQTENLGLVRKIAVSFAFWFEALEEAICNVQAPQVNVNQETVLSAGGISTSCLAWLEG